jgi:hypothetical protein
MILVWGAIVLGRWMLLSFVAWGFIVNSASGAGYSRHVLMDYSDVLGQGGLFKGEIAYYPSLEAVIARLGDAPTSDPVIFSTRPKITSIGNSSFTATPDSVIVMAKSKVQATDGTTILVSSNATFTLAAIDAATPLVQAAFPGAGGWNYLWLAKSGSTLSVYASSAAIAPALPTGVTYDKIGYLGTVKVKEGIPGPPPFGIPPTFIPVRKLGKSYTLLEQLGLGTALPTLSSSVNSIGVTLDMPYSAFKMKFFLNPISSFGSIAPPPTGVKACFLIGASSEQICTFDVAETNTKSIQLSHTYSGNETIDLHVYSYEESLDSFR